MNNSLPKVVATSKKRVGRGMGSGKGSHTVGRGQKGQKTRNKMGVLFQGVKVRKSLIKRLPLQRGKDKFKTLKKDPIVINLKYLNLFSDGSEVTIESLAKSGIIKKEDAMEYGVKILGDGKLDKKLTVMLPVSKSASKKIEEAGGKVSNKI